MLETIACLAMDLPTETGRGGLRAARSRLLTNVRTLAKGDIVRGQARGYQDEKGVAKDSTTETFAILRFTIESPRWKGVPFFVRVGKSLAITATEVVVRWKGTKTSVLEDGGAPAPNHLRFWIGPDTAIALGANVKAGGEGMVGEARELVLHRARWRTSGSSATGSTETRRSSRTEMRSKNRGASLIPSSTTRRPVSVRAGLVGARRGRANRASERLVGAGLRSQIRRARGLIRTTAS
jgi:hypothetical protein